MIGGRTVHDEDRRRLHQEADRLEAGDRVVACLSHLRIDEIGICSHQQGGAIGRGARYGFGSDHSARAWAVLDHHRHTLRTTDLLRHQARHEVSTGARRDRNDDLDRSRSL
jgi:hypothetical protein